LSTKPAAHGGGENGEDLHTSQQALSLVHHQMEQTTQAYSYTDPTVSCMYEEDKAVAPAHDDWAEMSKYPQWPHSLLHWMTFTVASMRRLPLLEANSEERAKVRMSASCSPTKSIEASPILPPGLSQGPQTWNRFVPSPRTAIRAKRRCEGDCEEGLDGLSDLVGSRRRPGI